jgi:hypothetical protein
MNLGWTGLDWIHVARLYDDADIDTDETHVQLIHFGDGEALVCLGCNRFILHSHAGAHVGALSRFSVWTLTERPHVGILSRAKQMLNKI